MNNKPKVVILAGGFGTRLSEETEIRPKPMVEIGGKPIIWHIMKIFSHFGLNDFIICLGYKGYLIKEYFLNYFIHQSDIEIDLNTDTHKILNSSSERWKVGLIDTGLHTMTGGRIKRVSRFLGNETFLVTYGDGLASIRIDQLIDFHRSRDQLATVTAVEPPGRFGALNLSTDGRVLSFLEKPRGDGAWINGGFFVLEPGVLDYIESDQTIFERDPLVNLSRDGQLNAFKHSGFWKPMDTLRDKRELEQLFASGSPPWMNWHD